jgi:hypothetical protein
MKYEVTIRAIVTKTIRVNAKNQEEAAEKAHEQFSVLNSKEPEDYEQDTVRICRIPRLHDFTGEWSC